MNRRNTNPNAEPALIRLVEEAERWAGGNDYLWRLWLRLTDEWEPGDELPMSFATFCERADTEPGFLS